MQRTLGRPLVRGKLSPLHALSVAAVCGAGGFVWLYALANPLTAWLGLANVALYAGVYTPMKRLSIGCTWAGAVVGESGISFCLTTKVLASLYEILTSSRSNFWPAN